MTPLIMSELADKREIIREQKEDEERKRVKLGKKIYLFFHFIMDF